ncbi:MAG: excinuclease ABC subunit UvrB [Alistipes sp.]|nr:excinuclease ABC subunit UvrB [Candidatus Alistipes equi]
MNFKLESRYSPMGDQQEAIDSIVQTLKEGQKAATLMGVTGSGKTFTVANVIERLQRPTLVLSHNKTLAAQLYGEFKNFFPQNRVEYFVSYYDYYQPEAYIPTTDTYIEKDLSINEEIDRLRLSATTALLSGRRDIIVVSSVSCLYGIGNPEDFHANCVHIAINEAISQQHFMRRLVDSLYTRSEKELSRATFRLMGNTIDVMTAFEDECYRIRFDANKVACIEHIDPLSAVVIERLEEVTFYPSNLFVTTHERIGKALDEICIDLGKEVAQFEAQERSLEARRLRQRVEYDMEMIKELGYCPGIENYSRYFDGREEGSRPFCLLDYFPKDYLLVVDESHVTIPQVRGMYGGDAKRKENLVQYGFRLKAAKDNRPLRFEEFEKLHGATIYVSATPTDFEIAESSGEIVEQIIRPTGLIDPALEVRPQQNQIDDLLEEIDRFVRQQDKVIVTTITKRMAEELSRYMDRIGIRNRYIHSDIDTLERVQILEDLREDRFDVLIGVNLLREGIDLPEVALVAILDADKEGFLRNVRSITQISGRAARSTRGTVIMYAQNITKSMLAAIQESNRRRVKQIEYNLKNGIIPRKALKSGEAHSDLLSSVQSQNEQNSTTKQDAKTFDILPKNFTREDVEKAALEQQNKMEEAARALDFQAAAHFRDEMLRLRALLERG